MRKIFNWLVLHKLYTHCPFDIEISNLNAPKENDLLSNFYWCSARL